MQDLHDIKVNRIVNQLKQREKTTYLKLHKKTVSHMVPKPHSKTYDDERLDISDFDDIILIDPEKMICVAEPGVTFEKLVKETMKYNLVPKEVSEFKTITIGGAVAGCSIESMSYQYGGFHDSCLEYEIVSANGEVLICTPDNENSLIFQMIHGTFGTLGIITKLTFKLIPSKPFIKVVYKRYKTLNEYKQAIWDHFEKRDIDFMDGMIHSPNLFVLSIGEFVDEAPYTHNYDWTRVYHESTAKLEEDYLTTPDYFFRYNKGVTNVYPKTPLFRLLFGRFINSNTVLRLATSLRKFISPSVIPITLDTFIPFSKIDTFFDWYVTEINHFPLWCVPYRIVHKYEWIADEFLEHVNDDLFLDIALYGMHRDNPEHYYRIIEKKLIEINAIKTLISTNLYSKEEFWKTWNKTNYDKVKKVTDPNNIFRDLYDKTCFRPSDPK